MRRNEPLAQPIQIGTKTSQNRFVINAMECCDSDAQGNPTEKTYERYTNLFTGGAGAVVLEAITVGYENRSREFQLSIEPHNQKPLEQFVAGMRKVNPEPLFIFQLTHSGELSHTAFSRRVCVKPLPGFGGDVLSEEDVDRIIGQFVLSAKIAHDAGADGVDLKFCHGYLGSQILRPYNDRKWKYGGPWENRRRFAFDMIEKVTAAVNDKNFLIGSKVSFWEGFPGGQGSPSITLALSQPDKAIPDQVYLHHTFQKAAKDVLKKAVLIGSAYSVFNQGNNKLQARNKEESTMFFWANKNIRDGVTDMIALGRQSLADPLLPGKYLEGREDEIKWCTACDNCIEFLIRQKNVGCATYNRPYTLSLQAIRKAEGDLREKRT
jgi:2,4-dienoyl-CoA reductase-like NADH-dependent reductase (Old Yellow Enzyme family)